MILQCVSHALRQSLHFMVCSVSPSYYAVSQKWHPCCGCYAFAARQPVCVNFGSHILQEIYDKKMYIQTNIVCVTVLPYKNLAATLFVQIC